MSIDALFYKGPWHGERHTLPEPLPTWRVAMLQPLQPWTYSRVDEVFPYAQPLTNHVAEYQLWRDGRDGEEWIYVSKDWLAEQRQVERDPQPECTCEWGMGCPVYDWIERQTRRGVSLIHGNPSQ